MKQVWIEFKRKTGLFFAIQLVILDSRQDA